MTVADLRILDAQTPDTLAGWHCLMNSWGWPTELPDEPPAEYVPNDRRARLMAEIADRVGHRAISRAWNYGMTDAEHADFWAGNFESDAAAFARYKTTPPGDWLERMRTAPRPPWAVEAARQFAARNAEPDHVVTNEDQS